MGVIKATFPDVSFDHHFNVHGCSQEASSLENIRCQWKTAIGLVAPDEDGPKELELPDGHLLALMKVMHGHS